MFEDVSNVSTQAAIVGVTRTRGRLIDEWAPDRSPTRIACRSVAMHTGGSWNPRIKPMTV